MKCYFITATDTDAGKTFVTTGLLEALSKSGFKTLGFKPVASGCVMTEYGLRNEDALKIINAADSKIDYSLINPYAFEAPIAPHIAAHNVGVSINLQTIADTIFNSLNDIDYVLVEGVGGWMVPLNDQQTMADLAALLNFPVIIVVNMRLGCINHALLTVDAIEQKGLNIAGWLANQAENSMELLQENIASIESRLSPPLLGVIPHGAKQKDIAQYINIEQYLL